MKMMPFLLSNVFIGKKYMDYKLIYVNKLNFNWEGFATYEFIFCDENMDLNEVWGDGWEAAAAEGMAQPPEIDCVAKVGMLKVKDYELDVAQNSMIFGLCDAKDDVIALAWEIIDENFTANDLRLVFRFGESIKNIENKLKNRSLTLTYEN